MDDIRLRINWEKWATFRNLLLVSDKGKRISIKKLVAASKKASFEIRHKQEQLVEVAEILVLFIGSDDCLLKFSGQRIIESEIFQSFRQIFCVGLTIHCARIGTVAGAGISIEFNGNSYVWGLLNGQKWC